MNIFPQIYNTNMWRHSKGMIEQKQLHILLESEYTLEK